MAEFPLVYGHPRSGTHFVQAAVKAAFLPDKDWTERKSEIKSGHWANRRAIPAPPAFKLRGGHRFYASQERGIYVYRDGRDVALSLWNTKEFQHPSWAELSFSEFLQRPLDWQGSPGRKGDPGLTIVEYWLKHVKSWYRKKGICYVCYEELLQDPHAVLDRLGEYLEVEPATYDLPSGPCAPFAGVGEYGRWKDVFSAEDLAYFYSIVDLSYWALWERGEVEKKGEEEGGRGDDESEGGTTELLPDEAG